MNMRWLIATLLLAALLAALHLYALEHFIYWHYRWFDTPMHILGGAMVGASFVAVFPSKNVRLFVVGVLFVAIGWEVFEYVFRISTGQSHYYFDTFHDIANDCIGAFITYLIAKKTIWHSV